MVMIASGHDTRELRAHERCLSRSSGETPGLKDDCEESSGPIPLARVTPRQIPLPVPPLGRHEVAPLRLATITSLLQLFGESGHDFENVCYHAVIGDLEDGRVLVFVYRHNRARALHADNVLNCAADSQGEIQFRRYRLAGTADLTIHRQPALVADWTRSRQFSADGLCQRFRLGYVFGGFDAAPDGHDQRRLR